MAPDRRGCARECGGRVDATLGTAARRVADGPQREVRVAGDDDGGGRIAGERKRDGTEPLAGRERARECHPRAPIPHAHVSVGAVAERDESLGTRGVEGEVANAVTMAAERCEGLAGVNSPDEHRGARGCLAGGEEGTVGGREGDTRERLRAALSVGGEGRVAAGTRLDDAGCAGRGRAERRRRRVVAGIVHHNRRAGRERDDARVRRDGEGAELQHGPRMRAVPAAGRRRVRLGEARAERGGPRARLALGRLPRHRGASESFGTTGCEREATRKTRARGIARVII